MIVWASVIMVRENPYDGSGESALGRFWAAFWRVPKRALG